MIRPGLAGLLAVAWLLASCSGAPQAGESAHAQPQELTQEQAAEFSHDIDTPARPWSHNDFDDGDDKFTFAVFSDLTGGEREGVFTVAVEQLNLLRPEWILNVGDLIEGGSSDRAQLEREWRAYDERADRIRAPVFNAGGNHDLTNTEMWAVWDERYGRRYYHFLYKDTLFLVMDTEDSTPAAQNELSRIRDEAMAMVKEQGWGVFRDTEYGQSELRKTGEISAMQAGYFQDVINRYDEVRHTFIVVHKPIWRRPGETRFTTIEEALAGRPYTVFAGHQHDYQHELRHGRDYIILGTTGGVHVAGSDMPVDHVMMVTVSADGVDIANLRLSGIFDKMGNIPAGGEELCFEDCLE